MSDIMGLARPRVKPIYPTYRLDDTTFRVGAQRGFTVEFHDPSGQLWELLQLADGTRDLISIRAAMQTKFPSLRDGDIDLGLSRLDREGLIDDSRTDDHAEDHLSRYVGNVNHFRHFSNLSGDPWETQRQLQSSRVTLLGLGGGGSVILPLLAALGVGHILAADYDRIDDSNLNRQFLYSEADKGQLKATVAKRVIEKLNSTTQLTTVNRRIESADDALDLVKYADLVICAIDEPPFLAQRRVNAACVTAGVPCLFGGSQVTRGRMFTVVPAVSGCFDCLHIHYSKSDRNFERQFKGFTDIDFNPPTIAFPPDILRLGSAIAGEAVRLLTAYQRPQSVGKQFELNFETNSAESVTEWERDPECPTCGSGSFDKWPIFGMYGSIWRTTGRAESA